MVFRCTAKLWQTNEPDYKRAIHGVPHWDSSRTVGRNVRGPLNCYRDRVSWDRKFFLLMEWHQRQKTAHHLICIPQESCFAYPPPLHGAQMASIQNDLLPVNGCGSVLTSSDAKSALLHCPLTPAQSVMPVTSSKHNHSPVQQMVVTMD